MHRWQDNCLLLSRKWATLMLFPWLSIVIIVCLLNAYYIPITSLNSLMVTSVLGGAITISIYRWALGVCQLAQVTASKCWAPDVGHGLTPKALLFWLCYYYSSFTWSLCIIPFHWWKISVVFITHLSDKYQRNNSRFHIDPFTFIRVNRSFQKHLAL